MKGAGRAIRLGVRVGIGMIAPLLGVGLLAGSLLDRGPSGGPRLSAFAWALVLLDARTWDWVLRSVGVAACVAAAACALGIAQAVLLDRRFAGRAILRALAGAPVALPPVCAAIGLRGLVGRVAPDLWIDDGPLGVALWFAAELAWASAFVGIVAGRALGRIDPTWRDAAWLAAGRPGVWRAWRSAVLAHIRPSVTRAAAIVFALTVLEPAAPLVLGLRRTLGAQVVGEVWRGLDQPRAAVLTILGVACGALGVVLLRGWGWGAGSESSERGAGGSRDRATRAGAWLAAGLVPLLALPGWLPIVGLAIGARGGVEADSRGFAPGEMLGGSRDLIRALGDSAVLGVGAATLAALLALAASARRMTGWASGGVTRVAPLAAGLAALALWRLLTGPGDPPAGWRAPPAWLTVMVVAWLVLPGIVQGLRASRGDAVRCRRETARLLGAGAVRAGWLSWGHLVGPALARAWVAAALVAACEAGALLVLTLSTEFLPIGPSLVDAWSTPGGSTGTTTLALLLALVLGSARLLGLPVAWFGTVGSRD
jgi:ABC-type Fe3+ transport system permease subunit